METRYPLMQPITSPTANVSTSTTGMGSPIMVNFPAAIADSSIMEPTDISKYPHISRNIMPNAMMAVGTKLACREWRFLGSQNTLLLMVSISTITIHRMAAMASFFFIIFFI